MTVDEILQPPYPDNEPTVRTADIPPHSLEAERIVVGSALSSPTVYEHLARQLEPADFYLPAHEIMWVGLAELAEKDRPIEPVALLAHLREKRQLKKMGAGPYIHSCTQAAVVPASADYYAREVKTLARRRAAIYALRQGLQRLQDPGPATNADETMRSAAEALTEAVEAIANPNPTTTWAPVDLEAALMGRSLDPPPEILARSDGIHLFYTGAVHSVSGESESGKTWLVLMAVVQLMAIGMPAVFIDFEDRPERVVGRLIALGATPDQIRDYFQYVRPDHALDLIGRHELEPFLQHAMLVIIDGVTEAMTLHGLEVNDNGDSARFYEMLPRWLADRGPGVVMIDHVSKDKEKRGNYAIGAQHKLAGLDGAAYIVKTITKFGRGKKGMAKVDIAKDRAGHVREYAVGDRIAEFTLDDTSPGGTIATLDPPPQATTTSSGEWMPTAIMEKVSKFVYGNPDATTNEILLAVSGKATHVRKAIEFLVAGGYLSVAAGPRNSKQHRHVKDFPPTDQGDLEDEWPEPKDKDES